MSSSAIGAREAHVSAAVVYQLGYQLGGLSTIRYRDGTEAVVMAGIRTGSARLRSSDAVRASLDLGSPLHQQAK
jgi:hypothetical protein